MRCDLQPQRLVAISLRVLARRAYLSLKLTDCRYLLGFRKQLPAALIPNPDKSASRKLAFRFVGPIPIIAFLGTHLTSEYAVTLLAASATGRTSASLHKQSNRRLVREPMLKCTPSLQYLCDITSLDSARSTDIVSVDEWRSS